MTQKDEESSNERSESNNMYASENKDSQRGSISSEDSEEQIVLAFDTFDIPIEQSIQVSVFVLDPEQA